MKQLLPRCEKRFQQSCIDVQDSIDCADAWRFCWDSFAWQYQCKCFRSVLYLRC